MYTLFGTGRAVPLLVGYLSFSVCTRLNYSFIYARRQHMQLPLILPKKKKSTNKNVLLLFRKVHCVAYLTENFVENSLVFCDLFALCVYTCAHQFCSALQENFMGKFPCDRFFFPTLRFLPNWQPWLPQKLYDFLSL